MEFHFFVRVIIIAEGNKTIVAFSLVVLFNRERSLVIALSLSVATENVRLSANDATCVL